MSEIPLEQYMREKLDGISTAVDKVDAKVEKLQRSHGELNTRLTVVEWKSGAFGTIAGAVGGYLSHLLGK